MTWFAFFRRFFSLLSHFILCMAASYSMLSVAIHCISFYHLRVIFAVPFFAVVVVAVGSIEHVTFEYQSKPLKCVQTVN